MKKTLYNVFHPEITTTIHWASYEEARIYESGEKPWDYIQRTNPRKARAILRRMDDSQPEAINNLD